MELNREEMIDTLSRVLPGLAKKITAQQSTSFVFKQGRIITYNGEICVSTKADWGFEGAVQANPLYKLLNRLTRDTVKIEIKEGQLRIACGRSRSGIKMDMEVLLPLEEITMPAEDTTKIEIPEGFLEAVQICSFNMDKNQNRPLLVCINIDNDCIQSGNNFRLTKITVPGIKIQQPINIPVVSMKELPVYNPTELFVTEAWAHFLNEKGTMFSCRLIDGIFPDLVPIIIDVTGPELRIPEDMEGILERAMAIPLGEFKGVESVTIAISDGKMTVKGVGPAGWFEETVRVQRKENCSFSINPHFFANALSCGGTIVVGENALLIKTKYAVHAIALQTM